MAQTSIVMLLYLHFNMFTISNRWGSSYWYYYDYFLCNFCIFAPLCCSSENIWICAQLKPFEACLSDYLRRTNHPKYISGSLPNCLPEKWYPFIFTPLKDGPESFESLPTCLTKDDFLEKDGKSIGKVFRHLCIVVDPYLQWCFPRFQSPTINPRLKLLHPYLWALGPLWSERYEWLEHRHCNTATVDQRTESATKWPLGRECRQCGSSGHREESCPGWDWVRFHHAT